MNDEVLHLGKDGVDVRGRNILPVVILLVFVLGVSWIFMIHLEKDELHNVEVIQRMESFRQDHVLLKDSIDSNTSALNHVNDQMELQTYLMVADDRKQKEALDIIGRPKLLQRGR